MACQVLPLTRLSEGAQAFAASSFARHELLEVLDTEAGPAVVSALSVRPTEATLVTFIVVGNRKIMSSRLSLEFMLVSNDYPTLTAVSASVKQWGVALTFAPNAESARSSIERRKIDAVIVDNELSGALKLIESIRKGASNSKAVIFVCVADSRSTTLALSAGANFTSALIRITLVTSEPRHNLGTSKYDVAVSALIAFK